MVSLEEYDKVQMILGREGKPRPRTHVFPFTGMIDCGECGCRITAETKKKLIKKTSSVKEYTYYHCTGRREDYKCHTLVKEECKPLEEEYLTLEPAERCLKAGTDDRIVSIRTRYLGTVHDVRTKIVLSSPYIFSKKVA